jgi:hypothetical protein
VHVLTRDGIVKRLFFDKFDLVTELMQLFEELTFSDGHVHDDSSGECESEGPPVRLDTLTESSTVARPFHRLLG